MTYKRFFGLTWIGPAKKMNKSNGSLDYDELVYLSTPIKDEHVLIVIELVSNIKDGKRKAVGWTAFRPFSSTKESTRRLCFYTGTPRALLLIDEPFEKNKNLTEIQGLYLNHSFLLNPNCLSQRGLFQRMCSLGGWIRSEVFTLIILLKVFFKTNLD